MVTQPVWVKAQNSELPVVEAATLRSHVERLSEELPGRLGVEIVLELTLQWLEKTVSRYATPIRESYQSEGENFHNLILRFGPKTGPLLVIGAHYDTAHGLPGADDNASGVAGLIELARLLSDAETQGILKRRVELVFYTLEESRFRKQQEMGSYIHAAALRKADEDVQLMLSLEMIGYFSDQPNSQLFPIAEMQHLYSDRGNFIGVISNFSNMPAVRTVKRSFKRSIGDKLPVYSLNGPELYVPGIGASDHRSYWALDYPAVMVTDTAYMRNPYYHTARDTADRLDYERMALVVQATYQLVMDLNEGS
ncbi:MAG: M28 family peptidase [Thiolinea sp.]